jgi:hypothetical protein
MFGWGWQDKSKRGNEIEFGRGLFEVFAALGLFALGDEMAKIARVLAAEGLFDGRVESMDSGEIDGHADPGEGLQQGPMAGDNTDERQHYCKFAQPL